MRVLVAGMGDVGSRAAYLLARDGHDVTGIRRSDRPGPPGVRVLAGDLEDPTLLARLEHRVDAVLVTIAADGRDLASYRAAYVDAPTTLLAALAERGDPVRRVVFTSSSAVYGQRDGEWVDERSATEPTSPTARIMLTAEQAIAAAPFPSTVLRLTGIYGAGRSMRLVDLVRRGEAVVGTRPAWTNRIHADDAAAACVHLLSIGDDAPPVAIATDDEPADRVTVYAWLAERLGVPGPTVDDAMAPDRGSKRCSNALLRSTGWAPAYPTFRDGYAPLV